MNVDPKLNAKRLVLLFWVMVAAYYFYVSYDYIRVQMHDEEFGDYVQYVVQLAGNENRTPKEVRALILVRADEIGLDLRGEQIKIQGTGQTMKVAVAYDVEIDVPIFRSGYFSKHYEHSAVYRQPR